MKNHPDIGSIFPIYSLEVPESDLGSLPFEHEPNVHYFSLCREAFAAIIMTLGKKRRKVLMPAYTCQTVITPFVEMGYDCRFFNVNTELRIDVASLRTIFKDFKPDVLVVHPYYGRDLNDNELAVLHELKTEKCVFINDLTQCIFSRQRDCVFDYYVGSLRKWFPIPDGAVAFSAQHSQPFADIKALENCSFVEQALDAMFLRGLYWESGDVRVKDVSRRIDKQAVSQISVNVHPHSMSRYSYGVLSKYDAKQSALKRLENYRYLAENLETETIKFLDSTEVSSAPLYFPVFSRCRDVIMKKLIEHRIYAPTLWPVKTDELLVSDEVRRIFNEVLAIPCDQRYDNSDLDRVVEVLNS